MGDGTNFHPPAVHGGMGSAPEKHACGSGAKGLLMPCKFNDFAYSGLEAKAPEITIA